MIHELLLTLAGHHGDLFNSDFDVDPNFPYLHQSEIILLGTLAKLGLNYSKIKSFICKYQSTNRIPIFKLGLVQSIDLWLKEYDSILVQLEMDSMKGDCTITLINYRLEIYHILFRDLLDFIEHIENDNSLVGVRLLNYLHIRLSTNGVPQLSDMYSTFLKACQSVFLNQMVIWMLHAANYDSFDEFFIRKKSDAITLWDSYELDSSQFPNFLPVSVVENCFLIGRVVLVLKKNPDTQSLIEKYRKVFDYHSKSAELDYNILEIDINSFKSEIVQILFTSVTIKNQISYPLHSFRQIYLMGQGDFNDEFIEQCWELKKKSDLALLPTSEREFNRLFKRIAEDYLHDEWAKFSLPNFEFIDVQKDYTGPIEFPKYLNYNVTWPFDLFVNSKDIESYNKLFSFFLSIKISIKKLVQIRKSIMTPQTPKLLWIMCSRQLFFFESLWSYIQERDQSVSIEDLSRKHEQVLKTLLSGCFLNDSKSSKLINENIVDIIKLSLKTCQLIEQSQQQGQYNLLMLQDINKVFVLY
ncbi:gamma-tubulin complex component protein [Globomyces pollinis-pini]|nr:gamma-tubulin complex component protein [Globomyces pollinis-pini]